MRTPARAMRTPARALRTPARALTHRCGGDRGGRPLAAARPPPARHPQSTDAVPYTRGKGRGGPGGGMSPRSGERRRGAPRDQPAASGCAGVEHDRRRGVRSLHTVTPSAGL
eukprot:gene16408-6156_t